MSLPVIQVVTLLLIGFSVFAAAILLLAYLFYFSSMQKSAASKVACGVLLLALVCLQLYHFCYLLFSVGDLFLHRPYVLLLLLTPPAFYFFSREILLPDSTWSLSQLAHLIPMLLGIFMPFSVVAPLALAIGAGYSVWLARVVYGMRRNIGRFRFEMFFFGFFAVLAILVLLLFLLVPYLDAAVFYIAYAIFTGIALVLVVAALIVFPEIIDDIADVARIAYAKTTLSEVDVEGRVRDLEQAMSVDKLFQNENLNLKMLAEVIGVSGHQMSEIINTRFGIGFSHYIREQRIAEAKRLLRKDKNASILSISLATGFRSQSNFYAAFRDIAGMAPGTYRDTPD